MINYYIEVSEELYYTLKCCKNSYGFKELQDFILMLLEKWADEELERKGLNETTV